MTRNSATESAAETAAPRLSLTTRITFGIPQVAINLMGAMIAQWLTFFYRPPEDSGSPALVGAGVFAGLMILGRVVDGIADPLVGHLSDRTRGRWGRRMPYIVLGTPLMVLAFAGLWFPPDQAITTANSLWLGAFLALYWIGFTIVVGPYYALLPEIARTTQERVRLSAIMAVFTAIGTLGAAIGVGQWQSSMTEPYELLGFTIHTGVEAFALLTCVISVLSFMLMPLGVKETPHDSSKEVPPGLISGVKVAFANPAFRAFLGLAVLVQLGVLTFVTGLPYLATQVLERQVEGAGLVGPGQGEAWTGNLTGILFGVALLSLPLVSKAADRWGKNRLMIAAGSAFAAALTLSPGVILFPDPAIPTIVLVVVLGFPASCALVLVNAIAADVVDYDEARSGVRREGIYAGASALIAKTAQGLGPAIVVVLLALFGDSRSSPAGILLVGPAAGLLIATGIWIFRKTPIADEGASGNAID